MKSTRSPKTCPNRSSPPTSTIHEFTQLKMSFLNTTFSTAWDHLLHKQAGIFPSTIHSFSIHTVYHHTSLFSSSELVATCNFRLPFPPLAWSSSDHATNACFFSTIDSFPQPPSPASASIFQVSAFTSYPILGSPRSTDRHRRRVSLDLRLPSSNYYLQALSQSLSFKIWPDTVTGGRVFCYRASVGDLPVKLHQSIGRNPRSNSRICKYDRNA